MEYRSQAAIGLILLLGAAASAGELQFRVAHDRLLKDGRGTLSFGDIGVRYVQEKPAFDTLWRYEDIQRLVIAPDRVRILTYQDGPVLLFGKDREYNFKLEPGQDMQPVYQMLKGRLDQRFVVEMAENPGDLQWSIPVKRLSRLQGSEGVLRIGAGHIVYQTARHDDSRTWRFEDIENISTAGPFELTINTLERPYEFQLKERLDEKKFQALWLALNRGRQIDFLNLKENP